MKTNKHIGSSFDEFLESEGMYHEIEAVAIKKYFAAMIAQKMLEESITKTQMAEMMQTSRAAVNRLLDPKNTSITLKTMESSAKAVGNKLTLELV